MKLIVRPSRLRGEIAVAGSKSHTIRGIAAALCATGRSILRYPLDSADTRAALNAALAFGAEVEEYPDRWEIGGRGGRFRDPGLVVDLANSGTGLVIMTGLAGLQDFRIVFDGDDSLRSRPVSGVTDALAALGAKIEYLGKPGHPPFAVTGPVHGGAARVDGRTSQYLSSLLLALPQAAGESVLSLDYLNEAPYVDITAAWLDALNVRREGSANRLHWRIPGNQRIPIFDRVVPADFSTAAFPLVAAATAGEGVTIRNLDFSDTQGDKAVFGFLERMGARLEYGPELLVAPAHQPLKGCEIDLNATPDALPVLSAAAALAEGETRLVNVPQARLKECDRIAVSAQEFSRFGIGVEELADGLVIHGGKLRGAHFDSRGDHRIAMALAVAALSADGESVIEGAECIGVSYPDFYADFRKIGADFSLES